MDFALTDEQEDFVDAIQRYCDHECGTPDQRERLTEGYTEHHNERSTRRWPSSAGSG